MIQVIQGQSIEQELFMKQQIICTQFTEKAFPFPMCLYVLQYLVKVDN